MKISEMNTTSFADFITASGDHLANILQNEQIIGLFSGGEKKSPIRFVADAASILMGDCREDVFAVLGAINGKSAEEVGNQNILVTISQLRTLYQDVKTAEIPE